jgi:hypothetical protein
MWEWRCSSTSSYPRHWKNVGGYIRSLATLLLGKSHRCPLGARLGRCMVGLNAFFCSCWISGVTTRCYQISWQLSLVGTHYISCWYHLLVPIKFRERYHLFVPIKFSDRYYSLVPIKFRDRYHFLVPIKFSDMYHLLVRIKFIAQLVCVPEPLLTAVRRHHHYATKNQA